MPFSDSFRRLLKRSASLLITVSLLLSLFSFLAVAEEDDYDLPWLWPVPRSYRINSLDYYSGGGIHNQGQCIDISANGHTGSDRLDIISATSGTVFYIQDIYKEGSNKGSGWGNYVIVRTGSINILYAHLKEVTCDYGPIEAGDVIGKMGNTGNSTGVHLHMQAYPVNSNSSSTAICVFDQYKDNPLYAPRFQFWRGLETNSVRYGAWIRKYYTTLSGVYYVYSGGLDLSYPSTPLSALVTVIRSSGAKVYSAPSVESQYETDVIACGESVAVGATYTDAFGDAWLFLSDREDGGWIRAKDVGFKEYTFETRLENEVSPTGTFGSTIDLQISGQVHSANEITSLKAVLLKGGATVRTAEIDVRASSFSYMTDHFAELRLDELGNGDYTFELYVTETAVYPGADDASSTYRLTASSFCIDTSLADRVPPLLEPIHIEMLTADEIILSCAAYDNSAMGAVTARFTMGKFSYEAPFALSEGRYRLTVPSATLSGSGEYEVTVTAFDTYANYDTRTITLTLPTVPEGEIWRVCDTSTPSLRVRSGPGLSYERVTNVYPGNTITVTGFATADDYLWGKYSAGWVALTYLKDNSPLCEYVSGSLYYLQYHLNGGEGEVPASALLGSGETFTVPSLIPTRKGCTFLGWSTNSAANKPAYTAGSTYTPTSSMTLFAVWRDDEAPVISRITISEDGYTKDPVTVTVVATENTDELYYSFDGGSVWQRSNSLTVSENLTFAAGHILVRDAHNNTTVYDKAFEVSNIDTEAPDITAAEVTVIPGEGSASFAVQGITDILSGIASYELSLTRDGTEQSEVFTITSHDTLALADGVYHAVLTVKDAVGNTATLSLDRFLIGEAQPLSTPSPVTLTATAATFVKLTWPKNDLADRYRIEVSLTEDFSDPLVGVAEANTFIFSDLEPGRSYYLRVIATCSDGVYLPSAPSETVTFVTLSNDTSVYGLPSMPDAVISDVDSRITWVAPYALNTVDLTAEISANAVIHYFKDKSLTLGLSTSEVHSYTFANNTSTLYLHVTAENGDNRTYELILSRAAASALEPTVNHTPTDQTLLVGQQGSALTLSASVTDGGTLSVQWYASDNTGEPVLLGEGNTCPLRFEWSGVYHVYAVVTNTNLKCQSTTASVTTPVSVIAVKKNTSPLNVVCSSYDYTGELPSNVTIRDYVGDGSVTLRYYSDSDGQSEIEPPIDAGVYYVKAFSSETDTYYATESSLVSFEIYKLKNDAQPTLIVNQPTLRDRNGYITVTSSGVEYSVNDAPWVSAPTTVLTFAEGDEVRFRYTETKNVASGTILTVKIRVFDGTTAIVPNGSIDMTIREEYLIVSQHSLTADSLLTALTMRDGVYLYGSDGLRLNGTDAFVATGDRITIEDEYGEYLSYTVIILGDMNMDGVVTKSDAYEILYLSNGMAVSERPFDSVAGDIDGDGVLSSYDARQANAMK